MPKVRVKGYTTRRGVKVKGHTKHISYGKKSSRRRRR